MNNFRHEGDMIDVVTPSGGYTSGNFYIQGLIAGVAVNTSLEAEYNVLKTSGVFELPKTTSQAWAIGQQLYWDPATSKFTTVPGELTSYGAAAATAESADTTGEVKIGGGVPVAFGPIGQQAAVADLTENSGAIGGTNNGDLPSLTPTAVTSAALTATNPTAPTAFAPPTPGGSTPVVSAAATDLDTVAAAVKTLRDEVAAYELVISAIVVDITAQKTEQDKLVTDLAAAVAAVRETAAKQNAALAKLRLAGIIEDA